MNQFLTNALVHWKSTASAILTATLAATAALLAYPPFAAHAQWVVVAGGVQAVAKVWIGAIQQDAGKQA
jgi:hypothetical protein